MKILVIPAWYSTAKNPTAGIFVKVQVQALASEKIEMAVLYADLAYQNLKWPKQTTFAFEEAIPTFRAKGFFPPKVNTYLLKKWADNYKPLYEMYREKYGRPDLIHAHSYMAAIAAQSLSNEYNIPYVITEHLTQVSSEELPKNRIEIIRRAYDGASQIISVSEYLKSRIVRLTTTDTIVIPNLVDTKKFRPDSKLPEQRETLKFISVGGLVHQKNYKLLIRAFALFIGKGNTGELRIVGEGREKKELRDLAESLNIANDVHLLGGKSQAEVLTQLREADVFVSSSRAETFGVVIIEAMSVGLPVLATRSGGVEELINERNGMLVEKGEPVAMARGLETMAKHYRDFDKRTIRQNIVERFDREKVAPQIVELYEQVIRESDNSKN